MPSRDKLNCWKASGRLQVPAEKRIADFDLNKRMILLTAQHLTEQSERDERSLSDGKGRPLNHGSHFAGHNRSCSAKKAFKAVASDFGQLKDEILLGC